MPRFDGYTATLARTDEAAAARASSVFLEAMWRDGDEVRPATAKRFERCQEVVDSTGQQVGRVAWGGRRDHLVMAEASGERTPEVVQGVRSAFPAHRCTRVDSCEDFESEGAWERLLGTVLGVKAKHRLYGPKAGDWDFPELGRTQYLGAPSSAVRVRLYEKGKEPDMRHLQRPDWCRLEIQVRPQKEGKTTFSTATAEGVWGASQYTRDLAQELFLSRVETLAAAGGRRLPDRERALRFMCRQYAVAMTGCANDLGGWDVLGLTLGEMVEEEQRLVEAMKKLRRS